MLLLLINDQLLKLVFMIGLMYIFTFILLIFNHTLVGYFKITLKPRLMYPPLQLFLQWRGYNTDHRQSDVTRSLTTTLLYPWDKGQYQKISCDGLARQKRTQNSTGFEHGSDHANHTQSTYISVTNWYIHSSCESV